MTGTPDPSPGRGQRRYSSPPVSNGSIATARSLDELIEESIVASEENQRRKARQTQAIAALLIAFTALVSFGVGVYSLLSAPAPEQDVDVEPAYTHHIHDNSTNGSTATTILPILHDFSDLHQEQIQNYRDGKALIINVHITHHAGTTFCSEMKKWGEVPNFACLGGDNWKEAALPAKNDRPWTNDLTAERTDLVRSYFHMISWEFGHIPVPPLSDTNWEYENLVSVYITRNPLDRLLSGGGAVNRQFGTLEERTLDQWWAYASNSTYTDNFALNRLTGGSCVDGDRTTESCLDQGKELLSRFTFVLDQQCLSESMAAFAQVMNKPAPDQETSRTVQKVPKSAAATAQERIKSNEIYDYLAKRNTMDTALYEWSKSISLVRCDALTDGEDDVVENGDKDDEKGSK